MYKKLTRINNILKKYGLGEIPTYESTHTEELLPDALYTKNRLAAHLLTCLSGSLLISGQLNDNQSALAAEKEIYALLAADLSNYLYEGKFTDRNQGGNIEMFPLDLVLYVFPHHKGKIVDRVLLDLRHYKDGKLEPDYMPMEPLLAHASIENRIELLKQHPDQLKNLKKVLPAENYKEFFPILFDHFKPEIIIKDFYDAVDAVNLLSANYLVKNALGKTNLHEAILNKIPSLGSVFKFITMAEDSRKLIATKIVYDYIGAMDSIDDINEMIRSMNLVTTVNEAGAQYQFVNPDSLEIIKYILDNSVTEFKSSSKANPSEDDFLKLVRYHKKELLPLVISSCEQKIIPLIQDPLQLFSIISSLSPDEFDSKTIVGSLDEISKGIGVNTRSQTSYLINCYLLLKKRFPESGNLIHMLEQAIPVSIQSDKDFATIAGQSENSRQLTQPLLTEIKETIELAIKISKLFLRSDMFSHYVVEMDQMVTFSAFFGQFAYNMPLKKAWDYACMADPVARRNALIAEVRSNTGESSSSRPVLKKWFGKKDTEAPTAEQIVDQALGSKQGIN